MTEQNLAALSPALMREFPLASDEYEALKASIAESGVRVPIEVDGRTGEIIDGNHRLRAAQELGVDCPKRRVAFKGEDAELLRTAHAFSHNLARRNLSPEQRRALQRHVRELYLALRATERYTQERAAALVGIAQQTGSDWERDTSITGSGNASTAKPPDKRTKLSSVEQSEIAKRAEKGEEQPQLAADFGISQQRVSQIVKRERGKRKREKQRKEDVKRVADADPGELPDGHFQTIIIDPPWDFGDEGDVDQFDRGRPNYATLTLDELRQLPVGDKAHKDAHIYLWITNRSLPKGFVLLEAWEFRYITMLTWVKSGGFGMGNYFRGSTEHMLFGVRGSLPLLRKNAPTHFVAPRPSRQHSAKPDELYELVASCSPGPRVDWFGRGHKDGFVRYPE